jgi:hypothetical protein
MEEAEAPKLGLVYLGQFHVTSIAPPSPIVELKHLYVRADLRSSGTFPSYPESCARNGAMVADIYFGVDPVGLRARVAIFDDGRPASFAALLLDDGRVIDWGDRERGFEPTDRPSRATEMRALADQAAERLSH